MSASSWDEAVPLSASPAVAVEVPRWSLAKRIAFRFAFSYLLLYNLPTPFDLLPFLEKPVGWYMDGFRNAIVIPTAKLVFGLDVVVRVTGSGDGVIEYVRVFCLAVLSVAATLLWSVLDRRRANYARLFQWLHVYVRFCLAFIMCSYGAVKVIQSQFPPPTLDRLLQPFGDASPMGLVWTFMGASAGYGAFTGAGEMLGGLLLTFRRTTLLGALVTIAVMANVVALNFFYDVPVKLFSLHLLGMAVFLALPDSRRLLDFFVLHRPLELFRSNALRIASIALRTLFVGFVLYTLFRDIPPPPKHSPFYGIWTADTLVVNGAVPAPNDPARWRRIVFDSPRWLSLQSMDDSRTRFSLKLDQARKTMEVEKRDELNAKSTLHYQQPDPNTLVLDGVIDRKQVHAVLHKAPMPAFRLTTRGFHWINEYPFNR